MMQTIKVFFTDFWPGFEKNNFFLKFLESNYNVVIDSNPDYLFCSVYGHNHLNYSNCIKILYTAENTVPDFNLFDYALGFHFLQFEDRYLRFPLHVYHSFYLDKIILDGKSNLENIECSSLLNRKFCNFIYSNSTNSDPIRDKFFLELSKYKKVDSGGGHLNNMGERVADKLKFIQNYKFTIAFENSSVNGYTTEKIIEPMMVNSIPIYFGNTLIHQDYNINSIIEVKNADDFERAIAEIILLDQNDEAYIEKLRQPWILPENRIELWESNLLSFFQNIFNQPLTKAKRRAEYGYNRYQTTELKNQNDLYLQHKKNVEKKAKIKSLIFGKNK